MKLENTYTLTLTYDEACALKIALGKQSHAERVKWGIPEEGVVFLRKLYVLLPYKDEEEEKE